MAAKKVEILVSLLKEHGIDKLVKDFSLGVKYHKTYNNLFQLVYSQTESDMSHPVTQVCRGIILDKESNFKVIALPYLKFFNYGEVNADKINWETAKVYEKLDGSIMTLYWYDDSWHLSSKSLPDGSGKVVGFTKLHGRTIENRNLLPTYSGEFWRNNYRLPGDKSRCYMFEVLLSNHKNVVHSLSDRVVLHGARDMETLEELDPVVIANEYKWDCIKIAPLTSLEQVIKEAEILKPHEAEGFVVCDDKFNRVKIKSPQFVAISLLCDISSVGITRRMLPVVQANEDSEFLAYFPQMREQFSETKRIYDEMIAHHQQSMDSLKDYYDDMKRFATEAKKLDPNPWFLFSCIREKKSIKQVFRKADIKVLENTFNRFAAARKREENNQG